MQIAVRLAPGTGSGVKPMRRIASSTAFASSAVLPCLMITSMIHPFSSQRSRHQGSYRRSESLDHSLVAARAVLLPRVSNDVREVASHHGETRPGPERARDLIRARETEPQA